MIFDLIHILAKDYLILFDDSRLFDMSQVFAPQGEESRASVPPADMQHALSLGCKGAANGYMFLGGSFAWEGFADLPFGEWGHVWLMYGWYMDHLRIISG